MGVSEGTRSQLAAKFEVLLPHLDERQRRLAIGAEARALGHGGIRAVARAAGVSEVTVSRGAAELESGQDPLGRVRRPGGGRRRLADLDPGLRPALLAMVEPDVRGDPMSPLRWTTKSTRRLAAELTGQGHRISADTVADLLREEGFSLQANAKTLEGKQHPDRDAQFRYLNEQVREHRDAGQPVISVDTKKKELVGEFKNGGREWQPGGEPVRVSVHDFADPALGKAVPYGIYDLAANAGWVNVGCDHDTAAFAVTSIRRWWHGQGKSTYPQATRLLITADAGGSNGYRTRAWKIELAALAAETGLTITVCHLPPSTSKWNKIEHRLFSHITMNWRGRPLTSHEVIVQTIAATTSRSGLRVHAELDTGTYPTGVRIGDADMAALPLTRHTFHGDWNYALHPALVGASPDGCPTPADDHEPTTAWDQGRLSDPALTGMPRPQLDALTAALAALHEAQPGAGMGRPPRLPFDEQVLATVLHLRLGLPAEPLAVLLDSSRSAVHRTFRKIRQLLDQHGTAIPPAASPPAALAALHTRVLAQNNQPNSKIKSAC
jgi:transposase